MGHLYLFVFYNIQRQLVDASEIKFMNFFISGRSSLNNYILYVYIRYVNATSNLNLFNAL